VFGFAQEWLCLLSSNTCDEVHTQATSRTDGTGLRMNWKWAQDGVGLHPCVAFVFRVSFEFSMSGYIDTVLAYLQSLFNV